MDPHPPRRQGLRREDRAARRDNRRAVRSENRAHEDELAPLLVELDLGLLNPELGREQCACAEHGLVAVDDELRVERVGLNSGDRRRPLVPVPLAQRIPHEVAFFDGVEVDHHTSARLIRALLDWIGFEHREDPRPLVSRLAHEILDGFISVRAVEGVGVEDDLQFGLDSLDLLLVVLKRGKVGEVHFA